MSQNTGIEFLIGGDLAPLAAALNQAAEKLDATGVKADELNKKIVDGAGRGRDEMGRFTKATDDAGAALKKTGGEGAAALGGLATEARTAASAVIGLSEVAKGLGAGLAAMGLGAAFHGLSAGIEESLHAFGSFQSTLNAVKAVTSATNEEMRQLQETAIKMGQVTKFSANEAASGMFRMSKDGFDAAQIIQALPAVLGLAAAANTSVDQTARIAAGSLRSFGLEAKDMGMIADVMAKATNSSGASLEEFGQTIKTAGPIARATGQSFIDISTEIAILGKSMISASVAGTGIQGVLTRLVSPPKEAAQELAKLKISIVDTSGAMLPLSAIVDQLREKTAGMSNAQKAATIEHISGKYALKDLLTLVDAAPDAFDKMKAKLSETGAASRIAATQMEGLNGAMKLMSSSIETAEKVFGEKLAPAAIQVAHAVQGVADTISSLPAPVLEAAAGLVVGVTAFLGLAAAAAAAAASIAVVAPFVVAGVAAMGTGVGELAIGLGVAAASLGLGTTALAVFTGQTEETTTTLEAHKQEVNDLVDEYEALRAKTIPTTEEQARMHAILLQLEKIAPEVTKGIDNMGHATDVDRDAIGAWNQIAAGRIDLLWKTVTAANAATAALNKETAAAAAATKSANIQSHDRETGMRMTDVDKELADIQALPRGERGASASREAALRTERAQLAQVRAGNRTDILAAAQENVKAQADASAFGGDAGHSDQAQVAGAAFVAPAPKGRHHGAGRHPHPRSGEGKANAAAATDEQDAKAEAEAEAKLAEVTDARILAADKALVAQQLILIGLRKDARLISEEDYLKGAHVLKSKEIDIDAAAHKAKLVDQQASLAAEYAAEVEAAGKSTGNAKKREETKAAVTLLKMQTLDEQLGGIEDARVAKHDALDAEDARKAQVAAEKRVALARTVSEESEKTERETALVRAEVANDALGHYEKLAAVAAQSYASQKASAFDAFTAESARIEAIVDLTAAEAKRLVTNAMESYDAAIAKIELTNKNATDAIKFAWVDAIKDVTNTLGGLITSPSIKGLEDLANRLAADPKLIAQWGDAIKLAGGNLAGMVKTLQAASDGAAITETGYASLFAGAGTLATGFGALVTVGAAVKAMFDEQTAAANALAVAVETVHDKTAKTLAGIETDPFKRADMERDVAMTKARKDLAAANAVTEAEHDKLMSGFHFGTPDETSYHKSLEENASAYTADSEAAAKTHADSIATALDKIAKAQDAVTIATDKASAATTKAQGNTDLGVIKKDQAADLASYNTGIEKLVALQKELAAGHDRTGNKVSLIAEASDQAALRQAEADLSHHKFLEEEAKIKAEIALIDKNEALDILKIQDQNIAIRSKSEFQTKTEEIKKITDKATFERTAKTQQLTDAQAADVLAQATYGNEILRIKALAAEKTAANLLAQSQAMANVTTAQQELGIQQSITAEIARRASGGQAVRSNGNGGFISDGGGGSYNSGYVSQGSDSHGNAIGSAAAATASAANVASYQHYADGLAVGPVPADGPAYLHRDEEVINPSQRSRLLALLTRPMTVPNMTDLVAASSGRGAGPQAGAITFGDIHITVPAGTTQQQAKAIYDQLAQKVRQSGGIRI